MSTQNITSVYDWIDRMRTSKNDLK